MDFTTIIAQAWATIGWLTLLMLVSGLLQLPWTRGSIGEIQAHLCALTQLCKQAYRDLYDVEIPPADGTRQIDHTVLSLYSIFVVETKSMSGWSFPSVEQTQWMQKLYKARFKLQNPLRQIYRLLIAVDATLGVRAEHLCSSITFVGKALSIQSCRPSPSGHRLYRLRPAIPAANIQHGWVFLLLLLHQNNLLRRLFKQQITLPVNKYLDEES